MSTPIPRIRRAEAEELPAVGRLTETAYVTSYGELTEEYRATMRDAATRAEQGEIWVAEVDGELLGTVWTPRPGEVLSDNAAPGEMDFRQLAVAPEARGRGIARALLDHVERLAQARGASRIVLNTGAEMDAARAVYRARGYARLPERDEVIWPAPHRRVQLLAYQLPLPR